MTPSRPLSQLDAFFVAYQARQGVAMQLAAEVELRGPVARRDLTRAIENVLRRWPQLGQRLRAGALGVAWSGPSRPLGMLQTGEVSQLHGWINHLIDPFREPPLQVFWVPGEPNTIAFHAHHAVADGESFFMVCQQLLEDLADAARGALTPAEPAPAPDLFALREVWAAGSIGPMLRYAAWLVRESHADRCARLAARSLGPGETRVCARVLKGEALAALNERSEGLATSTAMRCSAAWARVVGRWNAQRDVPPAPISIELPFSARRARTRPLGNYVSPLVLLADPSQTLEEIASGFRAQLIRGIKDKAHLGMPLLTAPGRYLPWGLFRRTAATSTWSGFATTHFTWLEDRHDLRGAVRARSFGALEVEQVRIHTPVCLRMGAGLCALSFDDSLGLFLAYREVALAREEAEQLADMLLDELSTPATRIKG